MATSSSSLSLQQQISSMAQISNLHRFHEEEHESSEEQLNRRPNPFVFDFDSFNLPNNPSNHSLFEDYATSFNLGFDLSESLGFVYDEPNCFAYGGEEDDDDEQINFVTDLFESRERHVTEDPMWELDSGRFEDSVLELGFGPGLGGLRVTEMDSESDSEEFEVNSGFVDNDVDEDEEEDDSYDMFTVGNGVNQHNSGENERDELEWEEVSERFHFDERGNLISVIDRIEEISLSSNISEVGGEDLRLGGGEREEGERNHAWEVLLAMSDLETNLDFDISEEFNSGVSEVQRLNFPEEILTMEHDAIFGLLVENENALQGSPPAAKSVVENLPCVVLTKEEMEENSSSVVCAVCKDEVSLGEKVTKMPCCHLYHGDCILPWLKIRNTCPVCRFELPTDDAGYEKRRSVRSGTGSGSSVLLIDDLGLNYNFELLP